MNETKPTKVKSYIEQYREEGVRKKWEWFWPEEEQSPQPLETSDADAEGVLPQS